MYQGVVVINKEPGFTSFDVVAVVRKIFGQKAVGHTGTLDPMASGVLPVCLGRATKVSELLLSAEKSYAVEMELGITTDTDDSTGKELDRCSEDWLSRITPEDVRRVLEGFPGDQMQVPPRYAAIKMNGKKLYEYARAGIEVEVPPGRSPYISLRSRRSIFRRSVSLSGVPREPISAACVGMRAGSWVPGR